MHKNYYCELCRLVFENEVKTHLYYDGPYFMIVDCLTCGTGHPMIVRKAHVIEPDCSTCHGKIVKWKAMMDVGKLLCKEKFGGRFNGYRDPAQRKIKDHWHRHILLKE